MERLQQFHGPVHGDSAVVQGRAEILFEYPAVKGNIQRGEHPVPAYRLQFREGQRALLDLPPEFSVLPVEHGLHVRLVGLQSKVHEALPHGLPDIGVKIQQGVVDVDKNHLHGVPLR